MGLLDLKLAKQISFNPVINILLNQAIKFYNRVLQKILQVFLNPSLIFKLYEF